MRITKLLSVVAGVSLATVSSPVFAENVELRIATLAPSGSPWMKTLDKAAAEIAQKTAGRVKMKYYEGGSQGDEKDFVSKIELGQLDGAAVTAVGLSKIDESIRVLELPMMFECEAEVDYVADKVWPYFQAKFAKKGFRLADRGEVGWIYFMSSGKVEKAADLKAEKLWRWGDDKIVGAMFAKLGLSGVSVGVPEVDAALTSKRLTAVYGSPIAAVALQWYSKVKYMTTMPMSFAMGATVMSQKTLDKISKDDMEIIEKIAKNAQKKLRKVIRKANNDARDAMVSKGVKIVTTPPASIAEFKKAADEVAQELAGKVYSKDELKKVTDARAEFRKTKSCPK